MVHNLESDKRKAGNEVSQKDYRIDQTKVYSVTNQTESLQNQKTKTIKQTIDGFPREGNDSTFTRNCLAHG